MPIEIIVSRISASEIRVTLTAEIRIGGDLSTLPHRENAWLAVDSTSGKGPEDTHGQELLTVDQAAEILHISRDRLYYLIRSGELRSIKIGRLRRIAREWITEFIAQQGTR